MSELLKTLPNGQWELLDKSNYGPKGAGAYSVPDNVRRKRKNTGEELQYVGPNRNVKQYGGFGGSAQAKYEDAKIKRLNAKQPVKTYTAEEIAQYKQKMNKSEYIEFSPNGQWSLT
jgi:hypothetical protein